ncbi:neurobeachin-like isoform X2 [Homarus americanus]|uniref:neurobeachin-like isoform X2 n=1 Tax=Homarus americanus TaxID=6706 RepID=UPI001C45D021|nr:neurobeachin-like isoform X2 [Homarus americanus]
MAMKSVKQIPSCHIYGNTYPHLPLLSVNTITNNHPLEQQSLSQRTESQVCRWWQCPSALASVGQCMSFQNKLPRATAAEVRPGRRPSRKVHTRSIRRGTTVDSRSVTAHGGFWDDTFRAFSTDMVGTHKILLCD